MASRPIFVTKHMLWTIGFQKGFTIPYHDFMNFGQQMTKIGQEFLLPFIDFLMTSQLDGTWKHAMELENGLKTRKGPLQCPKISWTLHDKRRK